MGRATGAVGDEGFGRWAEALARALAPFTHDDHEHALACLLSEKVLGPVEEYGRELPGYYVAGFDRPGKQDQGEELLREVYGAFWKGLFGCRFGRGRLIIYSGCDVDGDDGWVFGIDSGRSQQVYPQGSPHGSPHQSGAGLVFGEPRVELEDLAARTEADLRRIYELVREAAWQGHEPDVRGSVFVALDTDALSHDDPLGGVFVYSDDYPKVLADCVSGEEVEVRDDDGMRRWLSRNWDQWREVDPA